MLIKVHTTNSITKHIVNNQFVTIGRNPSKDHEYIQINSQTISRSHLVITLSKKNKIYVEDLGSSNGTFINDEEIKPKEKVQVGPKDKIKLGEFEGWITAQAKNHKSSQSQESSPEVKERSRDKEKSNEIILSESTITMIKEMTQEKKSKEQKIKFLKLMGHKNVEEQWDQIQRQIKQNHKKVKLQTLKKAEEELSKQFAQGRTTQEKKGLGR